MINKKLMIPEICKNVEFTVLEDGSTLCIQKDYGFRIKVNLFTSKFLALIDGRTNIENLAKKFNEQEELDVPIEDYIDLLEGILRKSGIVLFGDFYVIRKAKPKYLKLRINLISYKYSTYVTRYMKYLFKEKIFWPLFIFVNILAYIIFILYAKGIYYELKNVRSLDMIIVFILMGVGLFGHEFGHASACDCFGAKHGNIGFGFYLFTPVMFADVSDVWRLPKRKRIIVNLAGIFIGNIMSLLFFLVYLYTSNLIFLYAFSVQCVEGLYNLNPLIKYDGYWIISDLLNFSNMGMESFLQLKKISIKKICQYNSRQWFLIIYSLASPVFIGIFLVSVLIFNPSSLLLFPKNFALFVYHSIVDCTQFDFFTLANYIPQMIFYYLIFKLGEKWFKKRLLNRGNIVK